MNSQLFHNFFLENCTSVDNYFFDFVPFRVSKINEFLFLLGSPKLMNLVLLSFTLSINSIFLKKKNEFSNIFFKM